MADPKLTQRNIRIILEYDGTRFLGFQRQKRARTVQKELSRALFKILRERVTIIPAGRTDSGVHARAQVVSFKIKKGIPLYNLQRALNTYLSEDVAVKKMEEVPVDFHARYSAKRKIYVYRVLNSSAPSPLLRFQTYQYPFPLDLAAMKKAAKWLVGRHDFRSFQAKAAAQEKTSVRILYRAEVLKEGDLFTFTFEGNGFLYNMVRNMVGTLLLVGRDKMSLEQFKKMFEAKDRTQAGPTAPPQGLVLEEVIYED